MYSCSRACGVFKGNVQFIFLCNLSKSGALRVCITLFKTTQKVLTKDRFHWLELITEILSFLPTNIKCKKNNQSVFLIFQNFCQNINKKTRFLAYFGPLKANYR